MATKIVAAQANELGRATRPARTRAGKTGGLCALSHGQDGGWGLAAGPRDFRPLLFHRGRTALPRGIAAATPACNGREDPAEGERDLRTPLLAARLSGAAVWATD